MPPTEEQTRRRPGRPRQTDEEQARVREEILRATEEVYAGFSHRDVTVTRIIEVAGVTRPNFYRYYRNAAEPLLIVLQRVTETLLHGVVAAVGIVPADQDGPARVAAGIDGYLAWSSAYRHLLPSVMADRHDPRSPVFQLRLNVLEAVTQFIHTEFLASDRPEPSRTNIDVFVTTIEYICYRLYVDSRGDSSDGVASGGVASGGVASEGDAEAVARRLMLRIAAATLTV